MTELAERVRTPLFHPVPIRTSELDLTNPDHIQQLYENWDRNKSMLKRHWVNQVKAKDKVIKEVVKERLERIVNCWLS